MAQATSISTVLFACVHNAARSQMAAAWFNAKADPARATAVSAGTQPAARIHPEVVEAMAEVGLDLSKATPRQLTSEVAREADLLVTLGCEEECPVVPGLRRVDWKLPEYAGDQLDRVRAIRDDLRQRVRALIDENGWAAQSSFRVRPARLDDFSAVTELLKNADLPLAGVREHWHHFFVAEASEQVMGAVGLEIYGDSGLLRSLVVDGRFRNRGVGQALIANLNPLVRAAGVSNLFLLTTSAADYFTHLGFERIPREQLPASLNASEELRGACPASAVAMAARVSA